jgi:hypothetical protein
MGSIISAGLDRPLSNPLAFDFEMVDEFMFEIKKLLNIPVTPHDIFNLTYTRAYEACQAGHWDKVPKLIKEMTKILGTYDNVDYCQVLDCGDSIKHYVDLWKKEKKLQKKNLRK